MGVAIERLDLQLVRPIFERPKSVSLTCPSEVMSKLRKEEEMERGGRREREKKKKR